MGKKEFPELNRNGNPINFFTVPSMFWFKKKPFQVKLKGRSGIEYREGDRKLFIGSEFLAGEDPGIVLYSNSLNFWQPPYEDEGLTEEELTKIKLRIVADLAEHNITAQWG